jgi:pimeloyl-ACP methyl ester carboxylesterase
VSARTIPAAARTPRRGRPFRGIVSWYGAGRIDGETRVFLLLLAILALHAGYQAAAGSAGLGLFGLALVLVLAPVLLVVFARGGRAARTLVAGGLGLVALSTGLAVYAPRVLIGGAGGRNYTGVLAALAGVALTLLAFRVALHGRRRRVKLLALPAAFVVVQWLLLPAINAGIVTNAPHARVAAASTIGLAGARDVSFTVSDGVVLRGWYAPGRNGAAVILLHGSHGNRTDTRQHLDLLSGLGYAVLAYDARGHGQSGGVTNALGWNGDPDLRGAVSFLNRQAGVEPGRIAALGLSMGGEQALRAAADGLPLRAVIADGAGASTLGDAQLTEHGPTAPISYSTTWLAMRATEAITHTKEPPPLRNIVSRIRVPVLLIASQRAGELQIDRTYQTQIGGRATLWHIADAGHTKALQRHPAAYRAHIRAFLAAATRR